MLVGIGLHPTARRLHTTLPILIMLVLPPAYCLFRVNGWSANDLVESAGQLINSERGQSLDFRVQNEDRLIERAIQRPWAGWGRWGENRVHNAEGRDLSVTDGLWIIILGCDGAPALLFLILTMILPVLLLYLLVPAQAWTRAALAPAGALSIALVSFLIDCIPNAMITPLYVMAGGGITGACLEAVAASRSRAARGRSSSGVLRPQAVQG
jgi:hypothetical protein